MAPERAARDRRRRPPFVLSVKATPANARSTTPCQRVEPSPGRNCRTLAGTPARCISLTASKAASGVCSAGLAMTVFPAAKAAATCPVKIASGKFHGARQGRRPDHERSPRVRQLAPEEPGPKSARGFGQERRNDRLTQIGNGVVQRFSCLTDEQPQESGAVLLKRFAVRSNRGAGITAHAIPIMPCLGGRDDGAVQYHVLRPPTCPRANCDHVARSWALQHLPQPCHRQAVLPLFRAPTPP